MSESGSTTEVLVIEDDLGFVKLLTVMNRRWDLPLTICSEQEEIEQALESPERFGLVISDCHVPRLDIMQLLGQFRQAHPEIPVVLMSNLDEYDLRREGEELAPELVEPKDRIIREPAGFADRIRTLLERHDG